MSRKKKCRRAFAATAALPAPKPPLPLPALMLRVGLILLAAAIVQNVLPQP